MKRGADAIIEPDADVMLRAFRRYDAAFRTLPPLNAWQGTDDVLLPLLDAAILEGRPLSEADFARRPSKSACRPAGYPTT
jgi:hypothetical protein